MKSDETSAGMLTFIAEHHVLSMATQAEGVLSSCSLFYLFIQEEMCFVFASSETTEHIKNIEKSPSVSAAIHNETMEVNGIKGLQIRGTVSKAEAGYEELYTQRYPYAKEVKNKTIWKLSVTGWKYTDNGVGFAKKEVWNY